MSQQKGQKRARKVLKRKQRVAREAYKTNLKSAIYARLNALSQESGSSENK